MVAVQVPATTANIGPGFDCIGAALGLYNYIEMDFAQNPEIYVLGEGADIIEKDETNLVYKAAQAVLTELEINKPLKITLNNNIPLARGLGSSAACIAGGMMAANRLAGDKLSFEKIIELATKMEGHPDNIVPALAGGFTLSIFDDDKVIYRKFSISEKIRFVVGIPRFQLKTSDTRKVLPGKVDFKDAVFNLSRAALLAASIFQENYTDLELICKDRLHQPYRSNLVPGMNEIIDTAVEKGALACFLSGAGPSVACFALEDKAENVGKYMVEVFSKENIEADYKVLLPSQEGVQFI
jgi:homoserine kinase